MAALNIRQSSWLSVVAGSVLRKTSQRGRHREAAGDVAAAMAADAVGQQRNRAAGLFLLLVLGLPEQDVVLVVRTTGPMDENSA